MATGTFKTTLLLAPLASSTATLIFSLDQQTFLSLLVHPSLIPKGTNALLPAYFTRFFFPGAVRVVAFLALTTWTSVGAIYAVGPTLRARGSLAWYVAAGTLAVGHLLFVPAVAPRVKAILDDEGGDIQPGSEKGGKKSNVGYLEEWLGINLIRTATMDLGAFVCAGIAVVKTFST